MPSTTQLFAGFPSSTGDEITVKHTGALYPGEVTDIDVETDTPIVTVTEDGIGTLGGWTFVDCTPAELQVEADMSWCWKYPPR